MLVGRDADLEVVGAFALGRSRRRYPLLQVTGVPGIGKTALLDAVVPIAEEKGCRVLRSGAVEFEADLVFGGLNQMLTPLRDELDTISATHREALEVVLGQRPGPPLPELVVGAAVLALIGVAARSPLLFVIDDAALLDRPSAMAIAYIALRAHEAQVRFLLSARSDVENPFVRSGFDVHVLEPLTDAAADALLTARFPAMAPGARRRVRDVAQGNPLALLDLPAGLDLATDPLPGVGPPADRLRALYARQLVGLPKATRTALLLAALAGVDTDAAARRLLAVTTTGGSLGPAEQVGLARVDPGTDRIEFRHPLVRASVVDGATVEDRRTAHALLADAFRDDPRRRAWHLGQSATWPAPQVADELEELAERMVGLGDSRSAVSAVLRAAELTENRQTRARRIGRASLLNSISLGDLTASETLLREARPDPSEPMPLALVAAGAHAAVSRNGDAVAAHRMLIAALDDHPGPLAADALTTQLLQALLFATLWTGRADLWAQTRRQLDRIRPEIPESLEIFRGMFPDAVRPDPAALRRLDHALPSLMFVADLLQINRLASVAWHLDRVPAAYSALERVIDDGRSGGAVTRQIQSLLLLARADWLAGHWARVDERIDEELALCTELGYGLMAMTGHYLRGLVDAVRGAVPAAESAAEQLLQRAARGGLHTMAAYAAHVQCLLAIGREDFEAAFRHAATVDPPGTILAIHPTNFWMIFDLVEAATRSGRDREAQAHVDAVVAADLRSISPRLAMLVDGASALVADRDWADLFARALGVPGAEQFPFDRARIRLAYGERLRRTRLIAAARTEIALAAAEFERLGAVPWLERSTRELRAAGGFPRPAEAALTTQETAIARLAATGLTNKEIGARLFLSPRTVSTHLSHVFAKLGVGSRHELAAALDNDSES